MVGFRAAPKRPHQDCRYCDEAKMRGAAKSQYLGDREVLVRCLGAHPMYLDTRDAGFAPHLIMDGFWEIWITRFVAHAIKPGDVAVDVGANFGYYSILMSSLAGPGGFCHVIEPNPEVARKLRKTMSVNGFDGRSRIHEVALGQDDTGMVSFLIPGTGPQNACVVPFDYSLSPAEDARLETVFCTSGDALLADEKKIDFVMIDAAGSEYDIVLGMRTILTKRRPQLLLGFNANKGYDGAALLDLLHEIYRCDLRHVDIESRAEPVTRESLLDRSNPSDWMLYFA